MKLDRERTEGEARASAPLVKLLIQQSKRILFTCTTPTGRETLTALYGETHSAQIIVRYLPFDAPFDLEPDEEHVQERA